MLAFVPDRGDDSNDLPIGFLRFNSEQNRRGESVSELLSWLSADTDKSTQMVSVPILIRAEEAALTLKAGATIGEVLSEYTGKRVVLRLASGDEIEETVTIVGNSLLHLAKLSGKEFYDAVVSIGKISSVRMRVRENEEEIEGRSEIA